jgi:hypothetical protein
MNSHRPDSEWGPITEWCREVVFPTVALCIIGALALLTFFL